MTDADVMEPKVNQVWRHKSTEREYQIVKVDETIFGPAEVQLVSLQTNFETGLDYSDLVEKFEFVRDGEPLKGRRRV